MKKILYLTNIPSPYKTEFFNQLGEKVDLTVIYELHAATNRDIRWNCLRVSKFREIYLSPIIRRSEVSVSLDVIRHIKRDYDEFVISGYGSPTSIISMIYALIMSIPYSITIDGIIDDVKASNWFKNTIKSVLIRNAKRCICSGQKNKEYLGNLIGGSNNIVIIPLSSVHTTEILSHPLSPQEKSAIRRQCGFPEGKVYLSVGRLIKSKGFDWLLQCWHAAKIQNASLIIVGSGPEEVSLKRIVISNDIKNVWLLDHVNKDKLFEYYKASDVFILPTQRDVWGLVIIEAMANGLPIISTNRCGSAIELVRNNGIILDYQDSNRMISAMKQLSDGDHINKMATESLSIIRGCSIENMVNKHFAMFTEE